MGNNSTSHIGRVIVNDAPKVHCMVPQLLVTSQQRVAMVKIWRGGKKVKIYQYAVWWILVWSGFWVAL